MGSLNIISGFGWGTSVQSWHPRMTSQGVTKNEASQEGSYSGATMEWMGSAKVR